MTPPELEASLEEFFRRRVRLVGGHSVKLAPTEAGVPDRLVVMPGGSIHLVELKSEGGSLSPIQTEYHRRMKKLGVNIVVLKGRDEIMGWLRRTVDAAGPQSRRYASRS